MNAAYELEFVLSRIRDAVEFAEAERDFAPLRKWINEAEKTINADQDLGTHVIISGGEMLEVAG